MTNNHEEIVTNQQIDSAQDADLISGLKAVGSKHQSKGTGGESVFSVINTPGNGKRTTISPNLISKIGSPAKVQVSVNDKGIAISSKLPDNDSSFTLRKTSSKAVIYSKELVDELTALFDLDFSGRSSISFYDVTYLTLDDAEVAFVPLRK
ncbi:hypothetical protein [Paenibacillus sp. FSL H8-0034]|uniref:hypothetical protein n=1 Tax=Paenibacillus sp. FSL H8-0034 TaxID=2954671 RepID=UPI0030FB4089